MRKDFEAKSFNLLSTSKRENTSTKAKNEHIKNKLFFDDQIQQVNIGNQLKEPPQTDMNIIQYPSELEQSAVTSQKMSPAEVPEE